jgi:glycosyltransferase involved in cell wall biosynthesis
VKRVLFNALAARSLGGGVARYAAALGRRLALADERVTVVTTEEGAPLFGDLPRERLLAWSVPPLPKGRLLLEEFHLPRLANRFDLLYQPDFKLPRGVRVPAIVTAHDLFFEQYPGDYGPLQRRYKTAQAERAVDRAAEGRVRLVSLTRTKSAEIAARYGLAAAPRVIPPGIDPGAYPARVPAGEREIPEGHFLFLNAQGERKGSRLLVKAIRGLSAGDLSRLSWIGPWNWSLETNELVNQRIPVNPQVVIEGAGAIPDAQLARLYSECTALLFPSLDEGFGLPVLEAIAAGCPVLASDLPGLREIFGDAPVYVAPDRTDWENAIREASRHPPELDPAARAAVLGRCDWGKTIPAHRALIDEMVGT